MSKEPPDENPDENPPGRARTRADGNEIPWELSGDRAADAVELELSDVLDLHSFPPQQIAELVEDYLGEARAAGFTAVRIIHGKGIGTQRRRVQKILARHADVLAFGDPPGEAGGWGATWAELRPQDTDD